jgi:plastocyanin
LSRPRHPRPWLLPLLLATALGQGCRDAPPAAEPAAGAPADTGILARLRRPAPDGAVHLVRVTAGRDRFAFEPDQLRVRPGDVVRFVLTAPGPESIAFDTAGVPPAARAYLDARGLERGPLLIHPGQVYDVPFTDAPAGRYPFRSVPHAEQGMRGVVIVQ